ncbi:MAG: hypothetical protein DRH56_02860 [Deltaproteobacteria bacterium]|nr:MAG: hypothetical protein DRH56_02860 [Deltaproteobacteria bacterium]
MLEINYTLFIQMVNFLILLFLLNIFLYKPIRKILVSRKEELDSLEQAVASYQSRARENEARIEESMVQARREGFAEKEMLRKEGLAEEKAVLAEAGAAVEKKLDQARSEVERKMSDVRKALEDQISQFSREVAEKILGRSV